MTTKLDNTDARGRSFPTLLVDIGNTNLKWCLLEGNGMTSISAVPHLQRQFADLAAEHWASIPKPSAVVVSNVAAEELGVALSNWVRDHWGIESRFAQAVTKAFGVINGYRYPEQLGDDRWLTLIAVHREIEGPVCIVDCGTAITVDIIQGDGIHLGGLILPGIDLMRHVLLERTHIPRVTDSDEYLGLGVDTETAVVSASVNAAVALIEKVVRDSAGRLQTPLTLVMTGSDALRIEPLLGIEAKLMPDLIMSGLAIVARGDAK